MTKDEMQAEHSAWEQRNFNVVRPTPTLLECERTIEQLIASVKKHRDDESIAFALRFAFDLGRASLGPALMALGMAEEVGELCHAVLKQVQGIRGTYEKHDEDQRDALGDIELYRMAFANAKGWKLGEIDVKVFEDVVRGRDWKSNPIDGQVQAACAEAPPVPPEALPPADRHVRLVTEDGLVDVHVERIASVRKTLSHPPGLVVVYETNMLRLTAIVRYEAPALFHAIALVDESIAERLRADYLHELASR